MTIQRLVGSLALAAAVAGLSACATTPRAERGPVPVTLSEYQIVMPDEIRAGTTVFRVVNTGTEEHGFQISGQGVERAFDTPLAPGESRELSVVLETGAYTVTDPLSDHQQRGESKQITVVSSSVIVTD
jgi:hypothetical protein